MMEIYRNFITINDVFLLINIHYQHHALKILRINIEILIKLTTLSCFMNSWLPTAVFFFVSYFIFYQLYICTSETHTQVFLTCHYKQIRKSPILLLQTDTQNREIKSSACKRTPSHLSLHTNLNSLIRNKICPSNIHIYTCKTNIPRERNKYDIFKKSRIRILQHMRIHTSIIVALLSFLLAFEDKECFF